MPNQHSQHLRSRLGKICVAITGSTPEEMLERAAAAVKETAFLEFRLDYLTQPAQSLPRFKDFLTEHNEATLIATCRRDANGGRFKAPLVAQFDILAAAAAFGFQIVDVELESAEADAKATSGLLSRLRTTGAALIVSFHDFKATGDLDAVYQRIQPFQPDFVKIVPTANSLTDNITLMRFLERTSDLTSVVGVCMGDAGIISRVLGLRAGSAFTFAAATVGEETAPGQIAARTLVENYRIEDLDLSTKVYGVAGDPIGKSLSPVMMNTAFRRETVNAVYLALQTSDVKDLVNVMKEIPLQGVSITMPHKQAILPYLEHTDPLSAQIGACNTVLRQGGKLYGFNTDVQGILIPLQKRIALKDAKVLVLGAGGAARAAVFALRDKGADVSILNRTPETAARLAKQAGAKVIKREALAKATFDVILNATPVGMAGITAATLVDPAALKAKLVFDMVYNPVDTPLLKLARSQGISVITGLEMFVQQGARQFEIWTGKPAPEEEMLKVVIHALRQAAEAAGEPRPSDHIPASVSHPPAPEEPEPDEAEADEPEPPPAPSKVAKTASVKTSKNAPVKVAPAKAPAPAPAETPAKPSAAKTAAKKSAPQKAIKTFPQPPAKNAASTQAAAKPPSKSSTKPQAKTLAKTAAKTPARTPAKATAKPAGKTAKLKIKPKSRQ